MATAAGAVKGVCDVGAWAGGRGQCLGGTMANAEPELITGGWGRAPSGVQGQVRGSAGVAPLKLKAFWSLDVQRSRQISHQFVKTVCFVTVHWCQSWGAQSAWCPQPRHWGACAPRPRLRRLCVGAWTSAVTVYTTQLTDFLFLRTLCLRKDPDRVVIMLQSSQS